MSATTKVDVANGALAFLGQINDDQIEDFEELTSDARAVRRFWDRRLEAFLEDSWWSFATSYKALTQTGLNPVQGWAYSYNVPQDFVAPRRILGYVPEERVPYEMVVAGGARSVYTNKQLACMEYTARVEDFSVWSANAIEAFEISLAIKMAPGFTGGVEKVRALKLLEIDALERALVVSHNSQERDPYESENHELTDARHGTVTSIRHAAVFRRA